MQKAYSPIFLIGSRACGKSTVGRALARLLRRQFVDTDLLVQQEAGCTIQEMVQEHGWEYFRDAESRALQQATAPNTIIATGGGMVLREANRLFMQQHGIVFYLVVPVTILSARLAARPHDPMRPPLTTKNAEEEVRTVLQERQPLYLACARHSVDATLPLPALVGLMASAIVAHRKKL
jgi:shikimate kinase